MAEKLTVPTDKRPTWFNRDMALGFLIPASIPGIGLPLAVVGAGIGGYFGRSRMKDDLEHGKEVNPPTFWNKTALIGGLIGWNMLAFGALAGGFTAALTGSPVLTIAGLAAGAVGSVVGGTYIGGRMGKSRMEKDYVKAKNYHEMSGRLADLESTLGHSKEQQIESGVSYTNSVTPEEAQALASRQKQGGRKDKFAEAIESTREEVQSQLNRA